MDEMGISNQVFSDMLQTPSQSVNFVDRVYAESLGLVGIAPLEEWKGLKAIHLGENGADLKDIHHTTGEYSVMALGNYVYCFNSCENQ